MGTKADRLPGTQTPSEALRPPREMKHVYDHVDLLSLSLTSVDLALRAAGCYVAYYHLINFLMRLRS